MINSIPKEIQNDVLEILRRQVSSDISLQRFSFVGGGCINSGGKLETSVGSYFLKWNDAKKYPGMFQAEANGLELLRHANAIDIPNVIGFAEGITHQFILMEFIESSRPSKNYWRELGQQLATQHRVISPEAGLDYNNYIGSLAQDNTKEKSWVDFFIQHRLEPQVKLLTYSDPSLYKQFDELYNKLPSLLVSETHSLLHGDLWSGNLITISQGAPCVIDPAVYFGNREAEISFTVLFGGFDEEFYSSYNEAFPLQPEFRERVPIYNLYPLLVHANLFGGSYLNQVKATLKKLVD